MPHPTLLFNSILLNNSVFQKHLGLTLDMKNMKNTHGGVLLLACNFTKSNTPPWVFFTFFKLYNGTKLSNASHTESTMHFFLSTAPTSSFLDKPSFRRLGMLMIIFYLNVKRN